MSIKDKVLYFMSIKDKVLYWLRVCNWKFQTSRLKILILRNLRMQFAYLKYGSLVLRTSPHPYRKGEFLRRVITVRNKYSAPWILIAEENIFAGHVYYASIIWCFFPGEKKWLKKGLGQ